MKFIDLFCGMGTIRMGFEQAGHECVYAVEWDKHKRRIYSVIFGHEPQGRDITDTRADDFPAADCWCFGAPCQDFSIAGLREGMEGDRSSLVREVFRLIRETPEEHRPEWLLYENVKGMLSSNKGFDYLEILFEMESLGYDIEWQVLNSKDFGIPQDRERVFTIGHLRTFGSRKIFPIRRSSCTTEIKVVGSTAPDFRTIGQRDRVYGPDGIMACLSSTDYKQPKQIIVKGQVSSDGSQAGKVYGVEGVFPTICAGTHGYAMGNIVCNDRVRKLTPRECMRLQGVPDYITDKLIEAGISDTQMYRAAGDACTVNVTFEIGKRLGN